jgi:hypothetical protein
MRHFHGGRIMRIAAQQAERERRYKQGAPRRIARARQFEIRAWNSLTPEQQRQNLAVQAKMQVVEERREHLNFVVGVVVFVLFCSVICVLAWH